MGKMPSIEVDGRFADDRKITVQIKKLCEADLEYLRDVLKQKGFQASF